MCLNHPYSALKEIKVKDFKLGVLARFQYQETVEYFSWTVMLAITGHEFILVAMPLPARGLSMQLYYIEDDTS